MKARRLAQAEAEEGEAAEKTAEDDPTDMLAAEEDDDVIF